MYLFVYLYVYENMSVKFQHVRKIYKIKKKCKCKMHKKNLDN